MIKYILSISLLLISCIDNTNAEEKYLLGTICRIKIFNYENNDIDSEQLLNEAFQIVEDIERRMSTIIPDSEISIVNNNSGIMPVKVSDDILFLIEESIAYSEITGGKFDISVGPLVKLWNIGNIDAKVPEEAEIRQKLSFVDYTDIEISLLNSTVFLRNKGMMLDLGGIAKGYAADKVRDYLLDHGVMYAIINMGGNVLVIGENPEERPWNIGIQDPFKPGGTVMGIVKAADETIVTSGVYERYFIEDDVHYHHILDTNTGYPLDNGLVSVTIITNSSTKADALSTGIFALGLEKGMEMVETMDDVDAIFITENSGVFVSTGIKNRFSITDDSFSFY